jgi:hypothetical protein
VTCSSLNNNAFSYKIKFIGDNTSGKHCLLFFVTCDFCTGSSKKNGEAGGGEVDRGDTLSTKTISHGGSRLLGNVFIEIVL